MRFQGFTKELRSCRDGAQHAEQLLRTLTLLFSLAIVLPTAQAHNGPPFPIITDRRVGPCVISLWAHPDIGTGTFWVMVDPLPNGKVPADLSIQIGVTPLSGRLPETTYWAWQEKQRGQVEFKSEVQFDQDEIWKVRVVLHTVAGEWETNSQVEATPPGYGRWDLLLFALPFVGAGFLWFGLIAKRMGYKKRNPVPRVKAAPQG